MSYSDKNHSVRFTKAITVTAELLRGELSAGGITAWEHHVSCYPIDVVEQALHEAQRRLDFFPRPHEVLDICREIAAQRQRLRFREMTNIDDLLPPASNKPMIERTPLSPNEARRAIRRITQGEP